MRQIFILLSLLITFGSVAQHLNLDSTFGSNGIKSIISGGDELGRIRFLDWDENSFLLYSKVYSSEDTLENVIYKINVDGTFDVNFGSNGKLSLPTYSGDFFVYRQNLNDLVIFFDGVGEFGSINNERAIRRYSSSGSLDTSFGSNGEVRISIGNSDGTGASNIVVLNDNSILFSDYEKFAKFNANGSIDANYGTNGTIASSSIGYMTDSEDGNLFFYDSLQIDKRDHNNNAVSSFGNGGSYFFPEQNDYLLKAYNNRLSYLELDSELPVKFYDLNQDGTLNTAFGSNGSIELTTDGDTLYSLYNFDFTKNKFYFLGYSMIGKPALVCYDVNGNLVQLNNLDSFKEPSVSLGEFQEVLAKGDFLFACGYEYDEVNDIEDFFIAKYSTVDPTTLSTKVLDNVSVNTNSLEETLEFNSINEISSIQLFDLSSQMILSSNVDTVNTSSLDSGVYIAQVKFRNGENEFLKILIK